MTEFYASQKDRGKLVTLTDGSQISGIWNLPASIIALLVSMILYRGIKESSQLNNIIVAIKVTIIVAFIALGWGVIDAQNWIADPNASGLAALVPPPAMSARAGQEIMSFGWPGVLTGAGVVFFAYIGFDAVSTAAQETVNPQRNLPSEFWLADHLYNSLRTNGFGHYRRRALP